MKYDSIIVGDSGSAEAPVDPFPFASPEHADAFKNGYANQQGDSYGRAIYVYASRWACAMENALDGNEAPTVTDIGRIADETSHVADHTPGMGITGFMHGAAVTTLGWWWRYGDLLRRHHNKDLGREDLNDKANATANPAIIRIG